MSRISWLVLALALLQFSAIAQENNPHVRHMERAHPTPIGTPAYEGFYASDARGESLSKSLL